MAPHVEIAQGKLSGFEDEGLQVFLGIPFAKPPTGEGRFRPPQAPEPWSGVRDAARYGPSAGRGRSRRPRPKLRESEPNPKRTGAA